MKAIAKDKAQRIEAWYRDRYRLPPNDPRFLSLTSADLLLEYWTVHYLNAPPGQQEFDTPDFDKDLDAFMSGDDFETVTRHGH